MARDFFINGEAMVYVKGAQGTAISALSELGLSSNPIRVTPNFRHREINVDAMGEAPADIQFMLADAIISMTLVHVDLDVLNECLRLAMGGPAAAGRLARAGTRLGANKARFAAGYKYVGLNIASPVGGRPWRFYHAYMTGPPVEVPLGVERSLFVCNWRAIPYVQDPWNGGVGADGQYLYDNTLDT